MRRLAQVVVALVAAGIAALPLGLTASNAVDAGGDAKGNQVTSWALGSVSGGVSRPVGKSCGGWSRIRLGDPGVTDDVGRSMDITKFENGMTWDLFKRNCEGTLQYTWVPRVGTDVLWSIAYEALAREILPDPSGGFAPSIDATYVNLGTWFWTDAAAWKPYSATAGIPGLSVTVTAVPTTLTFDPGDIAVREDPGQNEVRSDAVVCDGPGAVWEPEDGDDTPSDCMHEYRHSTSIAPDGVWHGTMTITWTVSMTATNGESRTLDPLTTSTDYDATVNELQAIIIRGTDS